ncbi:hypothetical protein B4140_0522 [Bacillus amyloliquefaciens]|nr:hypothetical protein B4140_0522 [Bacillus amyloliquefaciens]
MPRREKTPSVSFWLVIRQANFFPIFLHKKLKKHRSFSERCARD